MVADAFVIDCLAGVEFAEGFYELLEVLEGGGLFAEDAAGAVATADAHLHAAVRDEIERGEEAGGDGDVAHGGICDAGAEAHSFWCSRP